MTAPDVIDGTAVEIPADQAPDISTAVVRRERRSEVIRPLSTDDLVESFQAYQDMLPRLLQADDYQDAGRGNKFVKKSGWRKIATAFDLDVQLIRSIVERDAAGVPQRAEVWARAIAPSGRSMDGDGYCSIEEDRFSGPRGNKSKLENDLRATATTRAMNRAISGLVGMGAVSAEEVGPADMKSEAPAWAAPATDAAKAKMLAALEVLMGRDMAIEYAKALAGAVGGQVPGIVAEWTGALTVFIEAGTARTETQA
jgi:hypothetical protein